MTVTKASTGAHLRQLAKTKGQDPEQFVESKIADEGYETECPFELEWHWRAFSDLNARRALGFNSFDPLTFQEVGWWAKLARIELTPFDVDVIMAIDDVFLEVSNGRLRATRDQNQKPRSGYRR